MVKTIDAEKAELKVQYCIPDWLRDQQIKMSCQRFTKRLEPSKEFKTDPVALVCFGTSLNKTWEEVKKFKYVISCSGSHKFLINKGITPTWHVDVDPREHKLKLIGDKISTDTTFLMASCVHPKVFDHLVERNANIVLWHTYSGEKAEVLPMVYPRGEWVVTGGANVGLRALTLARALGFRDVHIFGMDGSFEPGNTHAEEHPNSPKDYILADYNGKQYATTQAFLECARMTLHELEMLPDVSYTFYGDGLIQDMVKNKTLNRKQKTKIAFYTSPTISKEYAEQNRLMHQSNATYGVSVLRHLKTIQNLYEKIEAKSLLDYGCGKGMLAKNLEFPIWEYDPAIPEKSACPRPADLVTCIDVLEHIEPECLEAVIEDLARCVKKIGYFVISTKPSTKSLPDGRNSHLIQEGKDWWVERLSKYFFVPENGVFDKKVELHVVVSPRQATSSTQQKLIVTAREPEECLK